MAKRRATRKLRAEYAKWFASQGGKARAKKLTTAERREGARKAARARWSKAKKRSR
jgi:hypothetical protein